MPSRLYPTALMVLGILTALSLARCTEEPAVPRGQEGAMRTQLCASGGGSLNTTTNECVCPALQKWMGARCEGGSTDAASATPLAAGPLPPVAPSDKVGPVGSVRPEPLPKKPQAQAMAGAAADIEQACRAAKGEWQADTGFCLCPAAADVLVGGRCQKLAGEVRATTCHGATRPGRFVDGECECKPGLIFAPWRGGCVKPYRGAGGVLQRECESSLNRGHWDGARGRCECPSGRIWKDELCPVQQQLSSQEVCESEYHDGEWDKVRRRCNCPRKQIWLNQSCRPRSGLSDQSLCDSEAGLGRWQTQSGTCLCPSGSTWQAAKGRCG